MLLFFPDFFSVRSHFLTPNIFILFCFNGVLKSRSWLINLVINININFAFCTNLWFFALPHIIVFNISNRRCCKCYLNVFFKNTIFLSFPFFSPFRLIFFMLNFFILFCSPLTGIFNFFSVYFIVTIISYTSYLLFFYL